MLGFLEQFLALEIVAPMVELQNNLVLGVEFFVRLLGEWSGGKDCKSN